MKPKQINIALAITCGECGSAISATKASGLCLRCYRRNYMRKWYRMPGNAEKVKARVKKYTQEHPEHCRDYERNHRPNKQKRAEYRSEWAKRNKERVAEICRECCKRGRVKLADRYIRGMMAGGSPLASRDFPKEIVEMKRLTIKIKREMQKNYDCK